MKLTRENENCVWGEGAVRGERGLSFVMGPLFRSVLGSIVLGFRSFFVVVVFFVGG